MNAFNPSTRKGEPGRPLKSRLAWSTEQVLGQTGLHRETPSQKEKFSNSLWCESARGTHVEMEGRLARVFTPRGSQS